MSYVLSRAAQHCPADDEAGNDDAPEVVAAQPSSGRDLGGLVGAAMSVLWFEPVAAAED
jgi:hypothetical protein